MDLKGIDDELAKIPTVEREALIRVGRQYGSDATLAQGQRTLNAFGVHKEKLVGRGFTVRSAERTQWCVDGLLVAGVGRLGARAAKKVNNSAVLDAMQRGKALRFDGVALLTGARDELRDAGDQEGARQAQVALEQTSSAGADPLALADQLERQAQTLMLPPLAAWATTAEAGGMAAALIAQASELRTLAAKTVVARGTPEDSLRLDLLDGLLVRLVRLARRAARAAARSTADPALAKAFELSELYPGASGPSAPTTPAPTAPAPTEG